MPHRSSHFLSSYLFQLLLCLGLLGILPMILVAYLNLNYGSRILNDTTAAGLYAIAQYQSKNIQSFIASMQKDIRLLAETPTFVDALKTLYTVSQASPSSSEIQSLENNFRHYSHEVFQHFIKELKFKNIFLVSPNGKLLYNIEEKRFIESLLNTQSIEEPQSLLRTTLDLTYMVMSPQVSDFASAPTGEGASLVFSHPVFLRGVLIGLLAVEVAADTIYNILDNYTGLDETGETVISQFKEGHILLLNPTRNAPHLRFEEDIFAKQPESAMYKALRGERGFGPSLDYRGQAVLAAWEYLPRLRWGLVVKKDLSEVLNPSARLKNISFSILLPTLGVVVVMAFFLAQRLSRPLNIVAKNAKKIAEGNLRSYYEFPMPNNELKTLAYALCSLHDHLKSFVHKTQTTEKLIANLHTQSIHSFYLQDKALYSHKTVLQRITRFSKQMQGLNRSVLERLRGLVQLSQKTTLEGDASQHKLKTLLSLIQGIEGVKQSLEDQFLTIQAQAKSVQHIFMQALKMADRSNILALNTTLEMHQMASSTLGFRVVAQEIQKLSEDMDEACLNIENHTQSLDQTLSRASSYLKQFTKIVEEESQAAYGMQDSLNHIMGHLTQMPKSLKETLSAVEEQTASIQRIEASMQAFQNTLFQNAHTLDRSKQSLEHLRHPSLRLEKELAEFKI